MYRRLKARPGLVVGIVLMAIGVTIAFLARTARADPEPIDIALGVDYLDASGTLRLDLPAGFFAPGSVAYQGNIDVERAPFGTRGPYESGTTNLILRRRTVIALSAAAPEQDILVDAVGLSLVGAEPITVATSTGPQEWDVAVTLADLPRFTYSEFALNLIGASQGTFSAELIVAPKVIFTRGADTRVYTFPPLVLIENEGTWTVIDGSPTEPLAVSQLPLGLALTASFVSADLTLAVAPAALDPLRPGPTSVDPTATVDPAVGSLGRFCTIGPMVTVAAGAVIGPYATIQNGAAIGANAVIGEGATIGPGASIGADCIVGADSIVRMSATLAQGAVISSNVDVGQSCIVGPLTRIGHDSTLGAGAHVNGGCIVEWEVDIGAGATVQSGVIISFGASIANGVTQSAWLRRCWCGAEGWLLVDVPSDDGPDVMVVVDHNTDAGSSINLCPDDKPTELKVKGGLQPEGSDSQDFDKIEALKDDVGNGSAPKSNGGTQENYGKGPNGGRHCGWYAEHLRRRLEAETCPGPGPGDPPQAKYSTSFTTVDKLNKEWKKDGSTPHENKWLPGHAYTDIHWPDGSVTWIEAQLPGEGDGEGRPPGVDNDDRKPMDGNENGDIEVWDLRGGEKTPDEPSDGDTRTCVFTSRAQATAAGSATGGMAN